MKLLFQRPILSGISLILLFAVCAFPSATAKPATPTMVSNIGESTLASPPAATNTLDDPQELETFMDGIMTGQMEEQHVAGSVVVVVKDGQVLLSKGYGFADVEKGIPVDAEQTLFRPGSVSKLFTWTAVMQLVEQGKIDLRADVNTYLTDFQIPATYPQPITMLDLMAHTAGFDLTSTQNLEASSAEDLISLEDYLAHNMPARIYPPSQFYAYSNYGAALAGYIVEQVSGEPYEQYIAAHILQPLGMNHSTMEQPLPRALAPDMSQGYSFNGSYMPYETWFLVAAPAGALSASGIDMGKFMLAHLQDGQSNDTHILKPETARLMHTRSFSFDPMLTGTAHGFFESTLNDRRTLSHSGDYPPFDTLLALIPEENIGFYVSYNCETHQAGEALLQAFLDHYFPGTPVSVPQPPADFASRVRSYTGEYEVIPSDENAGAYWKAFTVPCQVQPGPGGTLLIDRISGQGQDTYVEVQPSVLQNTRTGDLVVFSKDERDQARYMAVGLIKLVKLPWYGRRTVKLGIWGISLLIFLSTAIAALITLFIQRRKRDTGRRSARPGRVARWVALALCVLGLGFLASGPVMEITHLDTTMALAVLAWCVAVLAPGVALLAVIAWWKRWWGPAGRLHYTVIALAGLALLWYEVYWEFLVI